MFKGTGVETAVLYFESDVAGTLIVQVIFYRLISIKLQIYRIKQEVVKKERKKNEKLFNYSSDLE